MRTVNMWLCLALVGCANLPWDAEGTMERVQRTKVLRAGVVAPSGGKADLSRQRFLQRLAAETGSETSIRYGSAEALLPSLEEGGLDIVVGDFSVDSPWADRVAIMPSPKQMGAVAGKPAPAAAVRHGENGWLTLIYEHAELMRGRAP